MQLRTRHAEPCPARRNCHRVDISDEAIDFARALALDAAISGTFERADLYDWLADPAHRGAFDLAFSSYGAIYWLSNLDLWARGLASILKPGGRFVLVEFHPFPLVFDEKWAHIYPYFWEGEPLTDAGINDYVGAAGEALVPWGFVEGVTGFVNPHRAHAFTWGIAETVSALLAAGLVLEVLREYPHMNGCRMFQRMRETPGRRMIVPEGMPNLPLMYGLAARKP